MRVLLLHNPTAGHEAHEGEELMAALAEAGHEAIYQSSKKKGLKAALKEKPDVVLVAGGDGTVGKIARRLVGRKVPLRVMPLGTANNLARALGFHGRTGTLIAHLADGQCGTFDVGKARGPWGKRYFFEGVGAGLFADYLQAPSEEAEEAASKSDEMKRHVRELRDQLAEVSARDWEIELDGEDFSGRYLLWEAMNIRSVGPALVLAPAAKSDDAWFDFVAARGADRAALLEYLNARLAGRKGKLDLPRKRFRKMRLGWKKWPLHFDDELWPPEDEKPPQRCEIEIAVKADALRIWEVR